MQQQQRVSVQDTRSCHDPRPNSTHPYYDARSYNNTHSNNAIRLSQPSRGPYNSVTWLPEAAWTCSVASQPQAACYFRILISGRTENQTLLLLCVIWGLFGAREDGASDR